MATQFDILNGKLDRIIALLESRGEVDFSQEVEAEPVPTTQQSRPNMPSMTRTHVEVKEQDGSSSMVPWGELDDRILEAVRMSNELGTVWQVYRGSDNSLRIAVSSEVAHMLTKAHTKQAPIPTVAGFDALGEDEVQAQG